MLSALRRIFAPTPPTNTKPASMSASQCLALRQIFLMTQAEAAQWVGDVSERSWQYWEEGRKPVPEDVAAMLRMIASKRTLDIDLALQQINAGSPAVAVWYRFSDDWRWRATPKDHPWAWKLHNSIVAELASRGCVQIVGFDGVAFNEWSKEQGARPRGAVRLEDEAVLHLNWAQSVLANQMVGA